MKPSTWRTVHLTKMDCRLLYLETKEARNLESEPCLQQRRSLWWQKKKQVLCRGRGQDREQNQKQWEGAWVEGWLSWFCSDIGFVFLSMVSAPSDPANCRQIILVKKIHLQFTHTISRQFSLDNHLSSPVHVSYIILCIISNLAKIWCIWKRVHRAHADITLLRKLSIEDFGKHRCSWIQSPVPTKGWHILNIMASVFKSFLFGTNKIWGFSHVLKKLIHMSSHQIRTVSIRNMEKLRLLAVDTTQKQNFSQSKIVWPTFEWLSTKVFNVVPMYQLQWKAVGLTGKRNKISMG